LLLFAVCFVTTTSFAASSPFDDALAAYERGDFVQAMKMFRELADKGHQWAQRRVGLMYAQGRGVPQDDQEAVKWYRLAAAQGNTPAQYDLGLAYEKGKGVPQDYAEAVKWYRIAASREDEWAQTRLGSLYVEGKGVPQDFLRAYMWFHLAALGGDSEDTATEHRDSVAAKMTAEQIRIAQEMARRCQQVKPKNCE
jgi:TPR repeat protein